MTQNTHKTKTPLPPFPFAIGADPEFLLFHGAQALDATRVISAFMKNRRGVERRNAGYNISDVGEIGWDGASSTAEIRPKASKDPSVLVGRIGRLLATTHQRMPFLDYTTLSIGSPIGGHIHLDLPGPVSQNARLTNRMQKLLASFLMPVIASEHRISSNARLNQNYGKADDMKWGAVARTPDGDERNQHLVEVRGLSAEWITSPKIALATICYMGVVWHEILARSDKLIKEKPVLKTKGHINAIQTLMLSDYTTIEKAVIHSLAKLVRQFELYPAYKEHVDIILQPKMAMRLKEKAGWNIAEGWGFEGSDRQPTKRVLMSDKKVAEKLKNTQRSLAEAGFELSYNDDYNVSFYAKAITDRVAALNWKLKHEYFLFGLKKGISGFAAMRVKEQTFYAIPSDNPKQATELSCRKMGDRFTANSMEAVRIDPKSGKTRRGTAQQIVVGIPFEPRTKNDIKEFLELIYAIENGKMQPRAIAEFAEPVVPRVSKEHAAPDAAQVIAQSVRRQDGTHMSVSEALQDVLSDTPAQ